MAKKPETIVISASMKFKDAVQQAAQELEALGFKVLAPDMNFIPEKGRDAVTHEEKAALAWDHYKKIDQADIAYFIVPGGYMGTSCKLELGYALAREKPIYFSELTGDIGLDCYIKKIIPVDDPELFLNGV